jgi:hypothetical protein
MTVVRAKCTDNCTKAGRPERKCHGDVATVTNPHSGNSRQMPLDPGSVYSKETLEKRLVLSNLTNKQLGVNAHFRL